MFMTMMGVSRPLSRQRRDTGDACETEIGKIGVTDVRELFEAFKWVSITSITCKRPGFRCSANSCPTRGHECV